MIWHGVSATEVLKHYHVDDKKGLSNGESDTKLEEYGLNIISKIEKPSFLSRFFMQLNNRMVIFLIIVAIISFIVSLAYDQSNSYAALLIIAIVIFNALISAYHIHVCCDALDNIKQMNNPSVTVLRDGLLKSVNSALIVPGDIIILQEGDFIPADARIIESNEFRCNEANLTGVEIPVEKNGDLVLDDITVVENRSNMVFNGCSVVHGNAKAIVTATGLYTEIGKTSAIMQQSGGDKLPLQEQLDSIGRITNAVIITICVLVFVIALIQNFSAGNFANMTMKVLLDAVALAVAAIPEGLPTIATVVIALGIHRFIADNVTVKNVSALELLGKTEILCCDKTGILTRNRMTLSKIFDGEKVCDLENQTPDEKTLTVLKLATACSTLQNDSTETAIEKACLAYNTMSLNDIRNIYPNVATVPFSSERKTVSVITMINKMPFAIVKGAAEVLVPNCINCNAEAVLKLNNEMAENGLRIVGIAMKQLDQLPANPTAADIEQDMIFVGLLALDDPPREGIVDEIDACKKAGIKPIMITGDNLLTAKSVALRIGILTEGDEAVTGAELASMTDDELKEKIGKYTVFARVSPKDKLRIVKAWKANQKIVTITGDNSEDAESLSAADVGCVLGKFGTDSAKGNADIIIYENHFHSMFKSIRESRGLFGNIRKSIIYLFSCNISEIFTVLIGLLIFRRFPVSAAGLLWINLLTDCAPAISLSMEKAEKDIMTRKSSDILKVLNRKSASLIAIQSIFISILSLTAYSIGNDFGDKITASTMAFAVLAMTQIFHCFDCKYESTIFGKKLFSNKFMNLSTLVILFVLIFLLFTPAGAVFSLNILSFAQFGICVALSLTIIPIAEISKALPEYGRKKIRHH